MANDRIYFSENRGKKSGVIDDTVCVLSQNIYLMIMLLLVFALSDFYIFLFIRLPKGDFKFKDKN